LPRNPLRRLCLWILAAFGWRTVYTPFPAPRGVLVVYPHTSNWDFVIGMLFRLGHGVPVHWLGKHSLFRWPFAGLLKRLGGIPVDRRAPRGAIRSIADEFDRYDFMWIALAPEGTRSHTDHWKSGFYQIALAANVPCGLGFIDYPTKTLGIPAYITFTGNVDEDLDRIRAFYADKRGLRPEQASDIRLRIPQPPAGNEPQSPGLPNRDSS
jgi:1-acyl-sn-glycerol-3-phosphate acyltransferase